ncbi:MAG: MoaD family protein [Candidatus Bathyarchaeia archaeon]
MYAGLVSEITGKVSEEIEVDNSISITELLEKLASKYGQRFREIIQNYKVGRTNILILHNGTSVRDDFDKKLNENDFVCILPMVSGG